MQLKALQERVPGADVVAGRAIAFFEAKHYDLGQYVGDGAVILSQEGEALVARLNSQDEAKKKPMGASKHTIDA